MYRSHFITNSRQKKHRSRSESSKCSMIRKFYFFVITFFCIVFWLHFWLNSSVSEDTVPNRHEGDPNDLTIASESSGRNEWCSVLQSVLFLVFRSSIEDDNVDGRDIIHKTWGQPHYGCSLHIKFVNTVSQRFNADPDGQRFEDVIQPPFESESGTSLLFAIEQFGGDYEWVFKLDDVTYVVVDNLVNYLIAINRYNDGQRMWWLGNRLQTNAKDTTSIFTSGGAGYLMNRAITTQIIQEIRGWDRDSETDSRRKDNEYGRYWLCHDREWEDMCTSKLLGKRYGVTAADTLDDAEFEKFNVWCPMTIFGIGGIYKLPIEWYSKYKRFLGQKEERVGVEFITKTPITFHYVKPEWMTVYHRLFVEKDKAQNIETLSKRIGKHPDREKRLQWMDRYGEMVREHVNDDWSQKIKKELESMGISKK